MSIKMTVTLTTAAMIALPIPAMGQDPVPIYPENYRVLLENESVRVLDFQLKQGAKENAHSHPAHVVYVLSPFMIHFTFPDGRTGVREAKVGEVLYSGPVTHASENIGWTDAHGILVELKESLHRTLSMEDHPEWLTAVTFIRGLEGKEEELKRELLALEAPTRAEPGNVIYDLYQSPVRENEFMRYEVWRNDQALEDHKATPHLRASFEKRRQQGWTTEITLWKRVRQQSPAGTNAQH